MHEHIFSGFTITKDDIVASNCDGIDPMVLIKNEVELRPDEDGYPQTYEEFLQYGARLPSRVARERGVMIGCSNYRILENLGIANKCEVCPKR